MVAVPIHQAGMQSVNPRHRSVMRWMLGAGLIAAVCWLSGVFELPLFTRLADRVLLKPDNLVVTQPNLPPAVVVPPVPSGNDSSISPVPLALVLTGTMPGRNAREGLAFIGVDVSSPQTYSAGAILINGARIAEIHTDRVVMEREGSRVNLYLHGTGHDSEPQKLTSLLTVGGVAPPPPAKASSHESLTDYIRPSPMYDGHILKGYQVYAGQRAGVFSQLGLQPGDVITAINGVPLNEPAAAIEQLRQIASGYAVTAVIERQGQVQSLSLDGTLVLGDQQQVQNQSTNPTLMMPTMN